MKLTANEVASLVRGRIESGPKDAVCDAVSIDTRTLSPGELFFAIEGPRHDGHDFVSEALARGASGVVASKPVPVAPPAFLLRVEDTTRALQELARGVRERAEIQVVAITGSMGKTTTKEATAAALGSSRRVLKSEGNLNNLYGLPLSLLKLRDEQVAVVEMGMSAPGEIRRLTEIARPDVGVLTNVAEVHLEFFPSVAAIAEAKGELLLGLRDSAVAVVNADDPLVLDQARKFSGRRIGFGLGETADVRARAIRSTAGGLAFIAEHGGASVEVVSPLFGRHNVYNLLAALAAASALEVPLDQAASGLRGLSPLPHRGQRWVLDSGVVVIDETYNANPRALISALDMLAAETASRRIAVLGDMLELGERAEELHLEAGRRAASKGLALLVGVGPLGRRIVEGAREAGMPPSRLAIAANAAEAGCILSGRLGRGDAVLFKASRGVGLEEAIRSLGAAGGKERQ